MHSMTGASLSAMDAVVGAAVALALAFVVAWLISAKLRERIEQPKYRFQERLSIRPDQRHK